VRLREPNSKRSPDERSDIRDFHISSNPAYRCAHAGYLLSTVVWEVIRRSDDCTKAVVPTLVDAVMARLTNHNTIIELISSSKFYMFYVMTLSCFQKFVLGSACFANLRNWRSTRRTKVLLPQ
jgi:hypothetical protein